MWDFSFLSSKSYWAAALMGMICPIIGRHMVMGRAIMLGLALIVFALSSRTALPASTRWLTILAGLCGVAGLAYFTFYALMLWILTIGVRLLLTAPRLASPMPVAQQSS